MLVSLEIENIKPFTKSICLSFEATKSDEMELSFVKSIKLRKGKKPIRILRLAMIYGANNIGKKSILEILNSVKHFCSLLVKKEVNKITLGKLSNRLYPNKKAKIKLEFIIEDILFIYEIKLNKDSNFNFLIEQKIYTKESISSKAELIVNVTEDVETYSDLTVCKKIVNFIEKITTEQEIHAANMSNVVILNRANKYLEHAGFDSNVVEKEMSTGTYKYLKLITEVLLKNKFNIYLLNKLENDLNPELFKLFLIEFLRLEDNSQLILTTHNKEFLQNELFYRRDCIWILDKENNNSSVTLYSLWDFDPEEIVNVYDFYSRGRLGGMPDSCY